MIKVDSIRVNYVRWEMKEGAIYEGMYVVIGVVSSRDDDYVVEDASEPGAGCADG